MPSKDSYFNSDTGRLNGQKSKRKPLDIIWRDKLEEYEDTKDTSLLNELFDILINQSRQGNIKAVELLLNRAYGKNDTLRVEAPDYIENPLFKMFASMRKAQGVV